MPAEQLARFGTPAPRALVRDIALVAGPLLADPNARAVFSQGGAPLTEGQTAAAAGPRRDADADQGLRRRRSSIPAILARRIVQASPLAGGPLALADLRGALPRMAPAIVLPNRRDKVAFLPPPADGGLAAAAGVRRAAARSVRRRRRRLRGRSRWRRAGGRAARTRRPCWRRRICRRRRCRPCPPPPASPRSTRTATRSPARSAWTTCSAPGRVLPGLGIPAGRVARRGAAAALFGGDRLEREHPRIPRGGRRLRARRARRWRWPSAC